jgi:hypothetical protein
LGLVLSKLLVITCFATISQRCMMESDLSILESTDLSSHQPLLRTTRIHLPRTHAVLLQHNAAPTARRPHLSQQLGQRRARRRHGMLFQRSATAGANHCCRETPHVVLPLGHRAPNDRIPGHNIRESPPPTIRPFFHPD